MTVNAGTLSGTGTVGDTVTIKAGGTLAPGNSAGALDTSNLVLNTGATLAIEIGGTAPGVGYDQVRVFGSVTLAGTLSISPLNNFTPESGTTFVVIDNNNGNPQGFDGINNDGDNQVDEADEALDAVSGTFAGLAEGATFTQAGFRYSISYRGGDGNDVVLTAVSAAPVVNNLSGDSTTFTEGGAPSCSTKQRLLPSPTPTARISTPAT